MRRGDRRLEFARHATVATLELHHEPAVLLRREHQLVPAEAPSTPQYFQPGKAKCEPGVRLPASAPRRLEQEHARVGQRQGVAMPATEEQRHPCQAGGPYRAGPDQLLGLTELWRDERGDLRASGIPSHQPQVIDGLP